MKYNNKIILKNGKEALLRKGDFTDGLAVFEEFGRNPRGFNSRISGFQELVYMLLEL